MRFKLLYSVEDLRLDGEYFIKDPCGNGVDVLLRKSTEEEVKQDHKQNKSFCLGTWEQTPSDRIQSVFADLERRQMPEGWNRNHWSRSSVDAEGRIKENHGVHLGLFPHAFQDFARSVNKTLNRTCERIVKAIRWRYDIGGPPRSLARVSFKWTADDSTWHDMPYDFGASVEVLNGFRPGPTTAETLTGILRTRDEPVGHELFREAWNNRTSNPRSSLLMGIAAAEVGFKECVADLAPGAAWVVENSPSPPLVAMLSDYLPTLPARCTIGGKVIPPPKKEILDVLRNKGVNLRNKVTHTGAPAPETGTLKEILLAVKDVLWMLDYYRGDEWALQNVRPEIRKLMGVDVDDDLPQDEDKDDG